MVSAIIKPLLTAGTKPPQWKTHANTSLGAPAHLDPRQRLVWVLARPLQDVPLLRSVGSGGFPILHWAVLIGEKGYGVRRMTSLFESLQNWPRDVQHFNIGALQELRYERMTATTSRNGGAFTTFDFLQRFQTSSIAYVGISSFTDKEIDDLGNTLLSRLKVLISQPNEYGCNEVGITGS